ncbi:MAG TPA: serine hydrolase, partial [Pyrinomonadaceae bacterium]|nr:serine hydrolase [Pyrinomonadaceae bacterium]
MKRALMVMLLGVVMPISPLAQGAPRNPGVNMLDAIAAGPTDPKEFEAWMDQFLADYLKRSSVSLGFVLVKDGKIFFQKGYGYADAEKKTPVVPDQTLFYAASVSKLTITRSRTYFTRLVGLVADTHVVSNGDGTLTLRLPPLGSKSLRMVEVEPLLFRAEGGFYINFGEDGKGNITRMFTSGSIKDPTAYDRLRWYESGLLHAGLGAA